MVGKFKTKVYADLKKDDTVATTDEERANFFAQHMANVCQTPTGDYYDENHKNEVEKTIRENESTFRPQSITEDILVREPEAIETNNDPNKKVIRTISEKMLLMNKIIITVSKKNVFLLKAHLSYFK